MAMPSEGGLTRCRAPRSGLRLFTAPQSGLTACWSWNP